MRNGFLDGNFAPVREELTVTDLRVTGEVPANLNGRYVRNGPNALAEIDPVTYEWFSATAMVHGVRLRDGRAEWYRNRWLRTDAVCDSLGEPRRPGPIHAGIDHAVHTNVIGQAGRTFVITEGGANPFELTEDLDTVGSCDFDGTLPAGGGYVSHPHRDPVTGEWHAVSYFGGRANRVHYTVLDTTARIRRSIEIPVDGQPAMHDFALTEHYIVIYDLPLVVDLRRVAGGLPRPLRRPADALIPRLVRHGFVPDPLFAGTLRMLQPNSKHRLPLRWDSSHAARIGVLPRDGETQDLRWFDVEPCHVWHTLNAYEADDTIVIDFVRYPKMYDTDRSWPNPTDGDPTLDRWNIDLIANKVREERVDDRPQEFPQVDERVVGRRHRYGYTVGAERLDPALQTGLVAHSDTMFKHDFASGATTKRHLGPGTSASEFVFVPSNADGAEDDGVVMGYVYDAHTDRSDLTMLDAQTLDTVAVVHLPTRVPFGFHGNWLPAP